MRILISTDCVGGVWNFTVSLANRLCALQHEVLVAVIGGPTSSQLSCLSRRVVVESRPARLEWMRDSVADLSATADWLEQLSTTWNAQVVHLNQMAYTALASFERPTVVVVHSDVSSWFREVTGAPPPAEWAGYAEHVRRGLAGASVVVTPSIHQGESTRLHYGRGADRVILNGSEPPPLASSPPNAAKLVATGAPWGPTLTVPTLDPAGQAWDSASTAPILLSAGRAWDPAKGIRILDDAIGLLGDVALEAHSFGSLAWPEGGTFSPRSLHCHSQVDSSVLMGWMERATVYVAPALYEPFGLATLEAAFRNCALVLSDIPTFRELWDGCAEFFVPGDAESLARSIRRVIGDPPLLAALAGRANARARERFTIERMAHEYLQLYGSLWTAGFPGSSRPFHTHQLCRPSSGPET